MTEQPTPRLPFGLRRSDVLSAAVTGLLILPDPARRNPVGRFALRTTVAGLTGAGMWLGTGQDPQARTDVVRRAAFTTGAVGLVYGVAELGDHLDAAFQRRLVRRGVRRPRLVMALVGTGVALALSVLERHAEPDDDGADEAAAGAQAHPTS